MPTSRFSRERVPGRWVTARSSTRGIRALVALTKVFGASVVVGSITWLLSAMSSHIFAGNSDGATVVLEGQSIGAGNILLHGWALSNDSFWSIDALFYALFVRIEGVTEAALHVVPALIAALVVLLGLWLVWTEERSWRFAIAGGVVILTLVTPNPDLSFFLLQGPWHVGTALYCLVAFAALAEDRWNGGFAVAVVVLVAGFLGDLATVTFGMIPVVFAGLARMVRARSVRRGLPTATAGVVSLALAELCRTILSHNGAFTLVRGITHATSSRYLANIGHAMTSMTGLLGVTSLAIGPASRLSSDAVTNGSSLSHLVHLLLLCVVAGGVISAIVVFVRDLIVGDRKNQGQTRSTHVDALLLSGIGGSIATYVYLCPNNNADYARYLSAALIFGVILSSRVLARALRSVHCPRSVAPLVLVSLLLSLAIAIATNDNLSKPKALRPTVELSAFLEQHHLNLGIGDYWSASIVTVTSDHRVTVRPVITNPQRSIVRYGRQSDASWYSRTNFQFLVYDVTHPWRDINATTAITTFGRPKIAYVVGDYRVIVWPKPLRLSIVGFTRG